MSTGNSGDADAHIRQGNLLYGRGDLGGAVESYRLALRAEPSNARAHYNLGVALHAAGRIQEAIAHYERAVEARPDSVKALLNWGNALRDAGDVAGARSRYERVLEIDPDDSHALNNLGAIAYEARELEVAEAYYARLLALDDGNIATHYRLGQSMYHRRNWSGAARHFERAAGLQPDFVPALLGWAHSLNDAGDRDGARPVYERLIAVEPTHAEALNNLASYALDDGRVEDARALLSRAAAARPDLPEARYNLALLALREHDFENGWRDYDLRMQVDAESMGLAPTSVPQLARGDLPFSGRVVVRKEQGVGDHLLFSTVLPDLRASGARALVETDPRLIECYRRSLPGIEFVDPEEGARALARCERQIPFGSLPGLFRRSVRDFESQPRALLSPDSARVEATALRLPAAPRIAISWRSFRQGRKQFLSGFKSASLEDFSVFEGCGATLVDVQYGAVEEERRAFDGRHPGLRAQVPDLDLLFDLEGVLAAIACCDLVITTSNVTAHFAGAIGKPAWVIYLAANPPFHYWAPRADGRSLWYPSVEIVTDRAWSTWEQAFGAVLARWGRLSAG